MTAAAASSKLLTRSRPRACLGTREFELAVCEAMLIIPDKREPILILCSGRERQAAAMSSATAAPGPACHAWTSLVTSPSAVFDPGYRWIALSNTTLGMLAATING